jgi:pyruvate formate lyase activating enzyme
VKPGPYPPPSCVLCGCCIPVCPQGLRRISGVEYSAENLAKKLLRDASYLENSGGGYTISGGEPTAQAEFLLELLERLKGSHRAMETSGVCPAEVFSAITEKLELILMDIKLTDPEKHARFTGADNALVLHNLELLKNSGKPHIVRVPVIPGVNDDDVHYGSIADLLKDDKSLIQVELLPYHKTAGAKYSMFNMEYRPEFDTERTPNLNTGAFLSRNVPIAVI